MNGINSISPGINAASCDQAAGKKRVPLLAESKTSTEADNRKQFKTELTNQFNRNNQSNNQPELILFDISNNKGFIEVIC